MSNTSLPTTQQIQQRLKEAGFSSASRVREAMVALADADCVVSIPTIHKVLVAGPGKAVLHESSLRRFHAFLSKINVTI